MDSIKEEENGILTVSNTQINSMKTHRIVVSWEKEGSGKQYVFDALHESNSKIEIPNSLNVPQEINASTKTSDDVPIVVGYVPEENSHKIVSTNPPQIPNKRNLNRSSKLHTKAPTRFSKRWATKAGIHNSLHFQQNELTNKRNGEIVFELSEKRSVSSESISAENKIYNLRHIDEDSPSSCSSSDISISHNIKEPNKINKPKRQEVKTCRPISRYPQITTEEEGDTSLLEKKHNSQPTPTLKCPEISNTYNEELRKASSNSFNMEPISESVECLIAMESEKSIGRNEAIAKTNKSTRNNKNKIQGHIMNIDKPSTDISQSEYLTIGLDTNYSGTGPTHPILLSESHTGVSNQITNAKSEIRNRPSTAGGLHLQNDRKSKHLMKKTPKNSSRHESLANELNRNMSNSANTKPARLNESHTRVSDQVTNTHIKIGNQNLSVNAELNLKVKKGENWDEKHINAANCKVKRRLTPSVEIIKQEWVPISEEFSTFESVSNTRIANLRNQIRQLRNRIADVGTVPSEHTLPQNLEESRTDGREFFSSNRYRGMIHNQPVKNVKDKLGDFSNASPQQDFSNHVNSQKQGGLINWFQRTFMTDLSTRSTECDFTDSLNENRGNGMRRVSGIYTRNWSCPDHCITCTLNANKTGGCSHIGSGGLDSESKLNELPLSSSTCNFYRDSKTSRFYVDDSEASVHKHVLNSWRGARKFPDLDIQPTRREMGDCNSRTEVPVDLDLVPQLLKKSSKEVTTCSSQSTLRNLSYATNRSIRPGKNTMPENIASYRPRDYSNPFYQCQVYSITGTSGNDCDCANSLENNCTSPHIKESERETRPLTQKREISVLLKDRVIVIDQDQPVVNNTTMNSAEPEIVGSSDSSSDPAKRKFKGEEKEVKMSPLCSLEGIKEIGSKIRKSFSSNHSSQDCFSSPNDFMRPPPVEKLDEIAEDVSDQRKATDELFAMYKDVINKFSLISGKLTQIKDEINELGTLVRGRRNREISDLDINFQRSNFQQLTARSSISWKHVIQNNSFDKIKSFDTEETHTMDKGIRFQRQTKPVLHKSDNDDGEKDDNDNLSYLEKHYSDYELNEEDMLEDETFIMKNENFPEFTSVKSEIFLSLEDLNINGELAREEQIAKDEQKPLAAVLKSMINEMEINSINNEQISNLLEMQKESNKSDTNSGKSFQYDDSMKTLLAVKKHEPYNVEIESFKNVHLPETVTKIEEQNLATKTSDSSETSIESLKSRRIDPKSNTLAITTLCDMNECPDALSYNSGYLGNSLRDDSSLDLSRESSLYKEEVKAMEDFHVASKPSLEHSKCYCKFIDFRFIHEKDKKDILMCDIANKKKKMMSITPEDENYHCCYHCCSKCHCEPTCDNSECKPYNSSIARRASSEASLQCPNTESQFSTHYQNHDDNDSKSTLSNITKYLEKQNTPIISYVANHHLFCPLCMGKEKNENPTVSSAGNKKFSRNEECINLRPALTFLYQLENNSDHSCCCSDGSIFENEHIFKSNALQHRKCNNSSKNIDNIDRKEDRELKKSTWQLKNMSKYCEGSILQDNKKLYFLEHPLKNIVGDGINRKVSKRNDIPLKYSFSYHEQGDKWRIDEINNCEVLLDKIVLCKTQSVGSLNIDLTPQVTEIYQSTTSKFSSGSSRLYKVHIDKLNTSMYEHYNPLITYILLHNYAINSKQFFSYFNKILQRKYLQPYFFVRQPFSGRQKFLGNDSKNLSLVTSDSSRDFLENQLENRNSRISTFINLGLVPVSFQALYTSKNDNNDNSTIFKISDGCVEIEEKQVTNFNSTQIDLKQHENPVYKITSKCQREMMTSQETVNDITKSYNYNGSIIQPKSENVTELPKNQSCSENYISGNINYKASVTNSKENENVIELKKNKSDVKGDCESSLMKGIDRQNNLELPVIDTKNNRTIQRSANDMIEKKFEMKTENVSEKFVPESKHSNTKHKKRFLALFFPRKSKLKNSERNCSDVTVVPEKSLSCQKKSSGNQSWNSVKGCFQFSQTSKKGQNKMNEPGSSFQNNVRVELRNDTKVNCQSAEQSAEEIEISNVTYEIPTLLNSLQSNVSSEDFVKQNISSAKEINVSSNEKDTLTSQEGKRTKTKKQKC